MTVFSGKALGLGLLSIGRPWGHSPGAPPSEAEAHELLAAAVKADIRYFDTAPAYGASERIFGQYLASLGGRRGQLTVATKFGEHWDPATQTTQTDHRYDALCRSLDQSLEDLGAIDILQLHKATVETIAAKDTVRALIQARGRGIQRFGASVSDLATAERAIASGQYALLQLPYNAFNPLFLPTLLRARNAGVGIVVNRPFAMGRVQAGAGAGKPALMVDALRFICRESFDGIILTGTRSQVHLAETIAAFAEATRAAKV